MWSGSEFQAGDGVRERTSAADRKDYKTNPTISGNLSESG